MSNNIQERTFNFSIRIVSLCDYLAKQRDTSYQISKQLVRSGTSIGALRVQRIRVQSAK